MVQALPGIYTLSTSISTGIYLTTNIGGYHSPFTVTSTGTVSSLGYGVYSGLYAPALLNQGVISATTIGVDFTGQRATVVNAGTITGSTQDGVYLKSGGSVTNSGTASTILGHQYGVKADSGAAVVNDGVIISGYGSGVYLIGGGYVGNLGTSASISGYSYGVRVNGSASTVVNDGTITGTLNTGIYLQAGGTVTNSGTSAAILGGGGVQIAGAGGTVVNDGVITGTAHYGVLLTGGGTVTNSGTAAAITGATWGIEITGVAGAVVNDGTITGTTQYGVLLQAGGTLTNAGTVTGSKGAVVLKGTGSNRLIVDQGAVFNGTVVGQGASDTLEFATGTGTLGGLGTLFTGFTTLAFDSGVTWTAAGTEAGFSGDSITGFTTHDKLDVTNMAFAAAETLTLGSNDILTIAQGAATLDLTFSSADTGGLFTVSSDGAAGLLVTTNILCFLAGTHIRTPGGEVAVEALRRGELVITADGSAVPVRWVGVCTVSTRFADPLRAMPIRIRAGALGQNIPVRDLLVSPDHALFLDGILVQAGALVNGISITREAHMPEKFVYYHVETENHTLILAEGVATETFVDNVDRMAFDNWSEHEALYGNEPSIREMPYPRAKSARQVPSNLRRMLDACAATGPFARSA